MSAPVVRGLLAAAALALIAAIIIAVSGGGTFDLGPFTIRSHDPRRPALAGLVLFVTAFGAGTRGVRDAGAWWWVAVERHAQAASAVIGIGAAAAGIVWGTFVAGGSDSYCYLNQAELFARGDVRVFDPLATDPAWPGNHWSFAPAGHNPAVNDPGYYVPICPAGYSVMLAAARVVLGRTAMFWVTPVLGAVAVYLTFFLGRRAAGPAAGLLAAILTACSPILLYQIVQPMNDVPAAALWTAALVAASGPPHSRVTAILAGFCTGLAITIRPNLFLLASVVGAGVALLPRAVPGRVRLERLALFGMAAAPGVVFVLAMQAVVYGSPLSSGYGDLSALFSLSHVGPNLGRYPRWLLEVHTPLVTAAALSPVVLPREVMRFAGWLLVFAVATLCAYLPYVVFDAWWYLRFLLPAIPAVLALTAAVLVCLLRRLPAALRVALYVALAVALGVMFVVTAVARDAFRLWEIESRFRVAGEFVAATLPSNAVIVTNHHSGSVRFYSRRPSAGWSDIDPGRLEAALAFFRRRGLQPFLLLEEWEMPEFRRRFAGDRLGALDWGPIAELPGGVLVFEVPKGGHPPN